MTELPYLYTEQPDTIEANRPGDIILADLQGSNNGDSSHEMVAGILRELLKLAGDNALVGRNVNAYQQYLPNGTARLILTAPVHGGMATRINIQAASSDANGKHFTDVMVKSEEWVAGQLSSPPDVVHIEMNFEHPTDLDVIHQDIARRCLTYINEGGTI